MKYLHNIALKCKRYKLGLRHTYRAILSMICALCCVLPLSACSKNSRNDVIRIGIKFDQPGLGFKKSGTYVGFDVDVAKYVAKSWVTPKIGLFGRNRLQNSVKQCFKMAM